MSILEKFKRFLGLEKYSEYVEKYLDRSNAKSAIYLSSVIICLEIFMISSVLFNHYTGETIRSAQWMFSHIGSYITLLVTGIIMLCYSIYFFNNIDKKPNLILGKIIHTFFSFVCIIFGIYISYLDYIKGEQFITLMTMVIFVFCFLIWRPIYSIAFLSIAFCIFYALCTRKVPATYATQVNLFIIWIAILMASSNSFHQRIKEAKNDEQIEHTNSILTKLSISDEVTGIANMQYFRSQAVSLMQDPKVDISKLIYLFLDIENFKNFNEKYGFLDGNEFLRAFAQTIEKIFKGSIVAYFSNDNFAILTSDKDYISKLKKLEEIIINKDSEIKMCLKTGAYRPEDRDCLPIVACDHARYACYSIKKHYTKSYCEYDNSMSKDFYKKQYIINNIDDAISNGYIKCYYQPVIDTLSGKLCGAEALARWDDPKHGFLSPVDFIQTLEEYHQIHKLDIYIVEQVCRDIKKDIQDGNVVIPISLNFSRMDFDILDLSNEVESCLLKYGIERKYVHVEITESALTENDGKLQEAMRKFRSAGYALWLDDFGSGYSGLNVLKEYDFDMMKIDMKFLSNFSGNQKAKKVLKSIVSLANELGMQTLTEGVETDEAFNFLKEIGCERLQGYLFGKPMKKEELIQKIKDGIYKV